MPLRSTFQWRAIISYVVKSFLVFLLVFGVFVILQNTAHAACDHDSLESCNDPEFLVEKYAQITGENTDAEDKIKKLKTELNNELQKQDPNQDTIQMLQDAILKQERILLETAKELSEIQKILSQKIQLNPELKKRLEIARDILYESRDIIPWTGLGVSNTEQAVSISIDTENPEEYRSLIEKLVGKDIPVVIKKGGDPFLSGMQMSSSGQIESELSVVEKQVRYNIPYAISDGMIDDVVLDCESGSLLLDMSSHSKDDVNLVLELPRNLLDPKADGKDNRFFILRDGDEIDYDEIPYNDYRKISMSFSPDTDKIEIIHAFVPELKPPMCKVADSPPYSSILPPLKQFKSGIPTNEIHCKDGLTMLLTPKNSRPVCVTMETAEKLIPRNWGIIVSRG